MADPMALIGMPWATTKAIYAAATVIPVFGVYLVVVRARRRFVLEVQFDWDDWLLLPAFMLIIGCALTLIVGVVQQSIGFPTPPSNDTDYCVDPMLQLTVKIELAFLLQMTLAFGLLKMSVTFFYRRIFATRRGSIFDWASWFTIIVSAIWTLVFFILFVVWTSREASALLQTSSDGTCNPQYYFLSNYFVLSDLMTNVLVWLLPFPMVWRLQIRFVQRLQILGALSLGAISVIGGAVKTMISMRVAGLDPSAKVDWELTISTALYWCMIEGGLAIVASCLPDLYYYAMKLAEPDVDEKDGGRNKPLPETPRQPWEVRQFQPRNPPAAPNANLRSILRNPQSGALPRGVARAQLREQLGHRQSRDVYWGEDRADPKDLGSDRTQEVDSETSYLDMRQDSVAGDMCPIHGVPACPIHGVPNKSPSPNGLPVSRFTARRQEAEDRIAPAPRSSPRYPNGPPPKLVPR